MYHLIYSSTPVKTFTDAELEELLTQFREKNISLGITGMLIWLPELLIQLIEGSEENVQALYKSIEKDKKHTKVTVLREGQSAKRQFPDWSMGFHSSQGKSKNLPGFEDLKHIVETEVDNTKTMKLLALLDL